ncbi:Serine/threonine-protein kinase PK-1 [Streptomyces sp. YIM 130001]|uniref:protein kinase n=1 Tax=Streptomyces sp. YIM 130001 TaxID=2259644 RepID=UPI000E65D882|nr:protein kinase [Streptomyces sp. YIM 130001]RII21025.1 Serine/threonine-protein kinase PK-1 [Streptomyces sp. YIM 130001]
MDDYAGRVLADRYRLPLPPSDEYEFAETRAFDTYSGQEVLVRQVPLPEVVEAEVLDDEGGVGTVPAPRRASGRTTRKPTDPAVRRAIEAAQAAAQIPDHPRLDQVFDVFAEGGSLWIVSEVVAARPLAALLAERPLPPYRAAEVASDVLTALRVLHAHGWVHRNITVRTVLVCDDGRIMLTGLAAGAAEDALCGYDPVPEPPPDDGEADEPIDGSADGSVGGEDGGSGGPGAGYSSSALPEPAGAGGYEAINSGHRDGSSGQVAVGAPALDKGRPDGGARPALPVGDTRAARAGAIAAYRAGARAAAAARVREEDVEGRALPGPRSAAREEDRFAPEESGESGPVEAGPPGRIVDPYGVGGRLSGASDGADGREPEPAHRPRHLSERSGASAAEPAPGWHGAVPRSEAARAGTDAGVEVAGREQDAGGAEESHEPREPWETGGAVGQELATRDGSGLTGTSTGTAGLPAGAPAHATGGARWDDLVAGDGPRRKGPATPLDAERARQARMTVVGAVTERWSPEQAGPVHENWQLAPPVGPATDLWALGALLFRAVQGHAPYPEDSTYELVQLVCAESPAFAEECGPLRPVVESLLRQDPTERPEFEELRGWLRSLIRSAPEPEVGEDVVPVLPHESGKLPVVRRRGELVRRRRGDGGRHKKGKPPKEPRARREKAVRRERPARREEPVVQRDLPERAPKPPSEPRRGGPRRLGRLLLALVLLGLVAAVAYAVMFMPKADSGSGDDAQGAGASESAPADTPPRASSDPEKPESPGKSEKPEETGKGSPDPQTTDPDLPKGFTLQKDPAGFHVAVAKGWDRKGKNGQGQVTYSKGDFELLLVPGRDGTDAQGSDPMEYQREKERELQPFRDSSWSTSTGMRRIDVGDRAMAEGQFTWQEGDEDEVYVRNLAMIVDGRYHVVMVKGPESERDEVSRFYEQAAATYRPTK